MNTVYTCDRCILIKPLTKVNEFKFCTECFEILKSRNSKLVQED